MSEAQPPVECFWDGDVFRPVNDWWKKRAARQYTAGEVYHLADEPERSTRSHNHYHASVAEAWKNLPEHWAERFRSPDALRKYALIKSGHCDSTSMPCPSQASAERFAKFVSPMDEFALVTVKDSVVTVYRAKSQSFRAMGKADFQRSKDDVLAIIADMIGVTAKELAAQHKADKPLPTQRDYLATG